MASAPDFLCLGVGGTVGEAWTSGLLAGVEDVCDWDLRDVRGMVGTSAGSIVAAALSAGHRPRRPSDAHAVAGQEHTEEDYARAAGTGPTSANGNGNGGAGDLAAAQAALRAAAGPLLAGLGPLAGPLGALVPLALSGAAPAGAAVRKAVLSQVPQGRRSLRGFGSALDALGARWDGRLKIVAVDRDTGRRTVFGSDGAPEARVRDAVLASCAVPGVFEPVEIGGREYVDGGVWSPTNLDALPLEKGDTVLLTNPTGFLPGPWGKLSQAVAALEAAGARSRGVTVHCVVPDERSASEMGPNLMAQGSAVERGLRAGYRQGRALGHRLKGR